MSFLAQLAAHFLEQYGDRLHTLAFVFPTRRAGLYFQHYLQQLKKPGVALFAPRAFSFGDFILHLVDTRLPDSLTLIFSLYRVYQEQIHPYPKEFKDFYPWGKMIIDDFDEIDKYLIDPDRLFKTLKEYKGVEDRYPEEKSAIYRKYTSLWEDLGAIYREFRRVLGQEKQGYEGMIYRQAAESIDRLDIPFQKVVFCGFNALTPAEKAIIKTLLSRGQAETFWDMDRYFIDDPNQEAGHFFRENIGGLGLKDPQWIDDRLSQPRTIRLIGVQSKVSQAKVLGLELGRLAGPQPGQAPDHIAVVLPDEGLLFPTLNSLPQAFNRVNITLGFPLQQTPVASLLDSLGAMQAASLSQPGFYYPDVERVLHHPYIKPLAADQIAAAMAGWRQENRSFLPDQELAKLPAVLQKLFQVCRTSRELLDAWLALLDDIRTFYQENEPGLFSIDYEYIFHFYTLITRLRDTLDLHRAGLDMITFCQLWADIVEDSRIPFTGEPLEGLQVMGVLETQTLDFENLFVLSVNEGYLPPGKGHNSFIPFDVRTALRLPTYKDSDAIAAYHFYRLLKNSAHITLIYTTEGRGGLEKSEKSRFIDQLLIEFTHANPQTRIDHQVIDFSFDTQVGKEIAVPKSDPVLAMLADKKYSASSLLDYLTCPLKYYLSHILSLKEEEEVIESPGQRLVGDIVHAALQRLYRPWCGQGKSLSPGDIEQLKKQVEPVLNDIYPGHIKNRDWQTGRNRIAFEVIKTLLENFFEKEKQSPGFQVSMLEEKINLLFSFSGPGKTFTVQITGKIDRLDLAPDDTYRLLDYKTGQVHPLGLGSLDDLGLERAADRREAFQLFFYLYLLKESRSLLKPVRLGIYPFKKLYGELTFITVAKSDTITPDMVDRFREILEILFHQLFDPRVPFTQTQDEKRCLYCPFQVICQRQPLGRASI